MAQPTTLNWYVLRNAKGEMIDRRQLTSAQVRVDNAEFAKYGLTSRWYKSKSIGEQDLDRRIRLLVREAVDSWRGEMEEDNPIQGSDAVDWLCSFYREASALLEEYDAQA